MSLRVKTRCLKLEQLLAISKHSLLGGHEAQCLLLVLLVKGGLVGHMPSSPHRKQGTA
jgi:hypothetical protein